MFGCLCAFAAHRYRFIDISYLRGEEIHKGKTIPEHTEHVVMFLPDVWSVVPSMMDYLALQASYKRSMLLRIDEKEKELRVPLEKASTPAAKPAAAESSTQKPSTVEEEKEAKQAPAAAADSQSQALIQFILFLAYLSYLYIYMYKVYMVDTYQSGYC
mgnify:FL=1